MKLKQNRVVLVALALGGVLALEARSSCAGPAASAGWADDRRAAARAEGPVRGAQPNGGSAWGNLAFDHLSLSECNEALVRITARTQVEIARRRYFKYHDTTAVAAGVHAFIAMSEYDSAASWASRDSRLSVYRRFALAKAKKRPYSCDEAEPSLEDLRSGSGDADRLLLAVWSSASLTPTGPTAGPSARDAMLRLANRLKGNESGQDELTSLLVAYVLRDTVAVCKSLEETERELAVWQKSGASSLDRFGDPLSYHLMSLAHALLAADASNKALAHPQGAPQSQLHLLKGQALYEIELYDAAETELRAAMDPLDIGYAAACLAGTSRAKGKDREALDFAQKCLESARSAPDEEYLAVLARVQILHRAPDWPTAVVARELIRNYPREPRKTFPAYWALGLIYKQDTPDTAKQMLMRAADGRAPYPGNGYADREFPETFCFDYIDLLASHGMAKFAPDLLMAFNALDQFSKSVFPSARPVTEGLRWLYADTYDSTTIQRGAGE